MEHLSLLKKEHDKDLFIDAIMSNMGVSTALFLCDSLPMLKKNAEVSATDLARYCGVTTGAAIYHLKRLRIKSYVERTGYRTWILGSRYYDLQVGKRPYWICKKCGARNDFSQN